MPYYGDHLTGDPGLFGKLFRGFVGVARSALGATPLGQAVSAGIGVLRAGGGAGRSSTPAPGVVARTQQLRAAQAPLVGAAGLSRAGVRRAARRRVSPFALRMAAARRARLARRR